VLLGKDATEAAVRQMSADGTLARARYVHFACHGILGLHDGQPPALVLSLVGNSGERDEFGVLDGFLRLDEVTNLKLNADLVVLSACRSGQGRLWNGEGVHGLARAFLHAGTKGVVCSLWSVDDKETAAFMAALYGRLKDGRPAADALRDTRLDMIRAGKAPLYWAPFILIGE
jgi:CHAT domain-containing protein